MARILSVDDQPHVTRVIESFLSQYGHEVCRARDGQEALEFLRSREVDILITDVDMPEMDGLTLLGQADIIQKLRGAIVLTGRSDYQDLRTQLATTVRVLPKPFSPSALVSLIQQLLLRKDASRAASRTLLATA